MSRFSEQMARGNGALLFSHGETVEYWPGGEEDDAVEVVGVLDGQGEMEVEDGDGRTRVERAELLVQVEDVPVLSVLVDRVVSEGPSWLVVEEIGSSGGMRRLMIERAALRRVGRGRGW